MNEVLMSQIEWPRIGRSIGGLNPLPTSDLIDWPVQGEDDSVKCFIYQNECRVYGDEIVLDKGRISHTRRIMECMKTPLFANI